MSLSIITATLNSANTIERTLASIDAMVDAGTTPVERLVIDGGSTDGTLELIRSKHPGTRIIAQTEKGLYPALNEGVRKATGDYIMFVHSDDELSLLDLTRIVLAPDRVTYGGVEFIDAAGAVLYRRRAPCFFKNCLAQYPFIFHPNAIYPRRLLLKYPFDADKYGLAADMWQINDFRHEVSFVATNAINYRFRIHPASSTVMAKERKPALFWLWRVYLFAFFEDHRIARIINAFRGKRAWSLSPAA